MNDKLLQWHVADERGDSGEIAYETRVEAEVAIERMRLSAIKRKHEAEIRAQYGHPWCTDDYELRAPENFAMAGYHPISTELTDAVYRLNADISNDMDFLREVLWKLRVFGEARIRWTCTGHTRADWQGRATAAFLEHCGLECHVCSSGDVAVRTAKGVAK